LSIADPELSETLLRCPEGIIQDMPIKIVCASLLFSLVLGCQGLWPRSAEGFCESRGYKRGTSDFSSCVERQRGEARDSRAQQYQIRSHGPVGR
jgi:hypothetical protein